MTNYVCGYLHSRGGFYCLYAMDGKLLGLTRGEVVKSYRDARGHKAYAVVFKVNKLYVAGYCLGDGSLFRGVAVEEASYDTAVKTAENESNHYATLDQETDQVNEQVEVLNNA